MQLGDLQDRARQEARGKIQTLLKFSEDLSSKVPILLKRYKAEYSSLHSLLNTNMQTQYSKVRKGISTIQKSEQRIYHVRTNLDDIDSLCVEAENLVDNYPFIKQVSKTHDNFIKTRLVSLNVEFCMKNFVLWMLNWTESLN